MLANLSYVVQESVSVASVLLPNKFQFRGLLECFGSLLTSGKCWWKTWKRGGVFCHLGTAAASLCFNVLLKSVGGRRASDCHASSVRLLALGRGSLKHRKCLREWKHRALQKWNRADRATQLRQLSKLKTDVGALKL
jgi:hypothetical protein